jgi:CheY-specific phosphatase CheX
MGIQFFGEFLIDRWVVTRGQLLEALELQDYRNTRFGELAVQQGFLTEEQARQVNERQRHTDLRFGDLAIQMGLMSREQVRKVLTLQKNNYLFLGESLLELGHVTEDILERELAIFEEEQSRFAQQEVAVPAGVAGPEVIAACVDLTRKMFLRIAGIMLKTGDPVILSGAEAQAAGRKPDYHLTVSVPLIASAPVRYLLSVSSEVAVCIAGRILGQDATRESEALVEDAVSEFCNIVCGNVVARLAQQGIELEIGPPESQPQPPEPDDGRLVLRYPLIVTNGGVDLRFLVPAAS